MNENLKATITRRLDDLPDDTGRQLLDYIEFLESKYHRSVRQRSTLEKIADNIGDTLRVGRLGGAAVKGTSQVMDAAESVMRGVAAAGRAVVDELQSMEPAPNDAQASGTADAAEPTEEKSDETNAPNDGQQKTA